MTNSKPLKSFYKKIQKISFFSFLFFNLFFSLFFHHSLLADRITSAFKQIQKGEFAKAKTQIDKQLEKDTLYNAGTFHVLAEYYFAEKNPAYNMDSAYFFVQKSINSYPKAQPKILKEWVSEKITLETAKKLKENIEKKGFDLAEKSNTLTAYQTFLTHFPKAPQVQEAQTRFYQISWKDARQQNSLEIYQEFMQKYPNAPQYKEANRVSDSLVWVRDTQSNTKSKILRFLNQNPKNAYRNNAIEQLYWADSWQNNEDFYKNFVKKYPQALITSLAYSWLVAHAHEKNTWKQLFNEFPNFPEKEYFEKFEKNYKIAYIPFLDSELFGYVNENGKTTISPSLEEIPKKHLCNAQFLPYLITQKNNRVGLQDAFGKAILTPQFDQIDFFVTGLVRVSKNAEQGIYHTSGKEILPIKYDLIEVLNDKFLKIRKNRRWGIATYNGMVIVEPKFTEIEAVGKYFVSLASNSESQILANNALGHYFEEKMQNLPVYNQWEKIDNETKWIKIVQENKVKLLDKEGNIIFSDFDNILQISENIFSIEKNKNWIIYQFIKNNNLHEIKPLNEQQYQNIIITPHFLGVKMGNKWGILDKMAKIHHEINLDTLYAIGENLMYQKAKKSYIQFPQKVVEVTALRNLKAEKGDYTALQSYISYQDATNKKGLFSPEGNKILPPTAQNYYIVSPKEVVIQQNGKFGLADSLGKFLLMPKYDGITKANEGEYILTNQRKFGLWAKGLCLIEPNFDEPLQYFTPKKRPLWFVAKRNNLFGVVDSKGANLIPLEYTEIIAWKDSIALALDKKGKWNFVHFNKKSQTKLPKMDFEKVKFLARTADDVFVQIEMNGFFGVYSAKNGNIIPPDYEHINNIGTLEHPVFFAEHKSKDKKRYQVVYFAQNGKEIWSNVLKEEEYLRIVCE